MITVIYLGLLNSVRNIGRSFLTVLAMALAALMMTSALTVGEGYTASRAAEYRAFLGGDVLVYPTWAWPTEADVAGLQPGQARLATISPFFGSPLLYFHPDYYSSGYLTVAPGGGPTYSMFPSRSAMDRAISSLESVAGVTGVVPYTAVPVLQGDLTLASDTPQGRLTTAVSLEGFFLRACPPNLFSDAGDEFPPELRLVAGQVNPPPKIEVNTEDGETLESKKTWESGVLRTGGRQVGSADGDALVAMVNRRAVISRRDLTTWDLAYGPDGQTVELRLPRIVPGQRPGAPPRYDFGNPVTVRIRVVGTYDVASRLYHWVPAKGVSEYEQLYLEAPEFLMPEAALDRVLATMGLPEGDLPPVGALLVRAVDQSKLEALVPVLREAVPGYSVVSVAKETAYANARSLPERIYECPPRFILPPLPLRQPAVPAEAGNVFGLVLFGFAGLLAAGNATLLVLSRRTEFAILKAVGMRSFEVGLMVMVEVVTLATIGLVLGFVAGEVGALPIILTNRVGAGTALAAVGRDFALVAPATLGCSILFSLVPVSRTLRITVAEAMRGNE